MDCRVIGERSDAVLRTAMPGHDAECVSVHCDTLSTSCPALCRASTPCFTKAMSGGFIYILANRRDGILYVGVTNDLVRRVFEHREGVVKGFSKTHGLKRLVYYEQYDDIRVAIQREKAIKHWPRAWKVRLINSLNREWDDLYPSLI